MNMLKPKITLDDLRQGHAALLDAVRAIEVQKAELNVQIARYLAERRAPVGYGVDLFGDGRIKPMKDCAEYTPEKDEDGELLIDSEELE